MRVVSQKNEKLSRTVSIQFENHDIYQDANTIVTDNSKGGLLILAYYKDVNDAKKAFDILHLRYVKGHSSFVFPTEEEVKNMELFN